MSAGPFDPPSERGAPSFLARIFGRRAPTAAVDEMRRLLSAAASVREVGPDEVAELERRFGVEVRARFADELEAMYRDFVRACLEDRRFSDDELHDIRHLAELFGLAEDRCDLIHRKVAREVYLRTIRDVMADGSVDPDERRFLAELQSHLGIPAEVARNMEDVRRSQLRSRGRWEDD